MEYLYNSGGGRCSYAKSRPVIALEIRLTLSWVPLSFCASPYTLHAATVCWGSPLRGGLMPDPVVCSCSVVVSHEATGLSARAFGFARGEGKPTFPNTALSRFLVYSVQLLCLGIELASQGHLRVPPVVLESVPGEWVDRYTLRERLGTPLVLWFLYGKSANPCIGARVFLHGTLVDLS
jgi:hypothetical protein